MNTLDLQEAADYLKIHRMTLQRRAKSGEIPGAKIGRAWVFLIDDLANYIRSQYTKHGETDNIYKLEVIPCSLKDKAQKTTIVNSPSVDAKYTDLLAPATKGKRKQ